MNSDPYKQESEFEVSLENSYGGRFFLIRHKESGERADVGAWLPFKEFRIRRVKKKLRKLHGIVQRANAPEFKRLAEVKQRRGWGKLLLWGIVYPGTVLGVLFQVVVSFLRAFYPEVLK